MLSTVVKNNLVRNVRNVMKICVRHNCEVPAIVMNNGNEMPIIGFGTWSSTSDFAILEVSNKGGDSSSTDVKEHSEEVANSVEIAIDVGYRHIDCAHLYKNESEIGKVLQKIMEEKGVTRESLFITSKLWNTFHAPDCVAVGCKKSLDDLCLDYLDMYLMHSPMGYQKSDELFPLCDGEVLCSDDDYIDTWKAMEDLVEKKLCKNIGISNFNVQQIKRLLENCKIIPQTLQVEIHPYLTQKELITFSKAQDICITAYSPMGSPNRPWAEECDDRILLNDYKILQLAEKHKRTPAQILLRYQVQCGHATIPASRNKTQIVENINVFDFELCPEDITNIESLNHNLRYFKFSGAAGHTHHPFETTRKTKKQS